MDSDEITSRLSSWQAPFYWENLGGYSHETHLIQGRKIHFVVERCREGHEHACTVDDVATMLEFVSGADLQGLQLFVFRQPKHKEELLRGNWGRMAYDTTIGRPQDGGPFRGSAVFLEAIRTPYRFWLNASLGPLGSAELARLREDGHSITRRGSRYLIECGLESVRNTQLYRTVLHEIGHWVDYLEKVERPGKSNTEYFNRPSVERERYAHAYADKLGAKLRAAGLIPFDRIVTACPEG